MASDTVFYEKLAEAVRLYPRLYNKSSEDFKDANKKKLCWKDVAAAIGVTSGKWTFYSFVMDLELFLIKNETWFFACSMWSFIVFFLMSPYLSRDPKNE